MDPQYLDTLKSLSTSKQKKVKIESKEQVLMEQANDGKMDLHEEIIKWFIKNPNPSDDKVHALAEKMGIDPDKFESHIYMILSDLIHEGRSKNFNGKYDPKELAMGIEVEKEHLPYPSIAEKIAKDHLAEIPDYYTRLKKMEKEGGVKEAKNTSEMYKEFVTEIFVQSSEIEALPNGNERDIQILRLGVIAEFDASNLYEKLALLAKDKRVAELMNDVSREEKVHAGEFEALLSDVDPDFDDTEDEGEKEVDDMF